MDSEEREVFPLTPTEAIYKCRAQIRGLVFPDAPAPKLKTEDIVTVMELMRFGLCTAVDSNSLFFSLTRSVLKISSKMTSTGDTAL